MTRTIDVALEFLMINPGGQTRLRLVVSNSTEVASEEKTEGFFHDIDPHYKSFIRNVYLPFSKETLWLRIDTCSCGGARLYYVKYVGVEFLEEHKPYYQIGRDVAEEIVFSQHVKIGRLHRFFGISPLKIVFRHVFFLRKKVLMRDFRLHQSTTIKRYFEDVFGV